MKIFYSAFTAIACLMFQANLLNAQRHVCGTLPDEAEFRAYEEVLRLSKDPAIRPRSAARIWVPIQFHRVGDNSGTGRIAVGPILDNLCLLNTDYLPHDIQFFMKDSFRIINSTALYDGSNRATAASVMSTRRVSQCMNIFIGLSGGTSAGGGVTLGYYKPLDDYIFAIKNNITGSDRTLSHEIGHYFALKHPFYGWEDDDVCNDLTAANNYRAPVTSPTSGRAVENVARTGASSNCTTSGDNLCSTPATYNQGFAQSGCNRYSGTTCNWIGQDKDPLGVAVDPDETNVMDYFIPCANSQPLASFTQEQVDLMRTDAALNSNSRVSLSTYRPSGGYDNVVPSSNTPVAVNPVVITSQPTISIANVFLNTTTSKYSSTVTWTSVPGATHYHVELHRASNANSQNPISGTISKDTITTGNSMIFRNLLNGSNAYYMLRVRPFNYYSTCISNRSSVNFNPSIASTIEGIPGINNFTVFPNPVQNGQSLNISLNLDVEQDAKIKLYDLTGKLVKQKSNIALVTGDNNIDLETSDLAKGLYVLTVESNEGVINTKVIVE